MDWTDGYQTDITYTYGYYSETNPVTMRFLLLVAGLLPPEVGNACELGYGQGISININAASETVNWTGTDFNPAQAVFARKLGSVSGAKCEADSFHDFFERTDLPEFDYIALHGIWSWIAPENQQAIVRLIDRKLRPGGALYISYNCYPGWAAFHPARDLMVLHASYNSAATQQKKAADAFAFIEKLVELKAGYAVANPQAVQKLEGFKDKNSSYLVHEFFNKDWNPCTFADMADIMHEARMTYACSAVPMKALPGLGLSQEQKTLLMDVPDPVLRETVLDFINNTQFRKDYWIKGACALGAVERASCLGAALVILTGAKARIERKIKTGMGEITISQTAAQAFQDILGDGHVHSIAELVKRAAEIANDSNPDLPRENLDSICHIACVLMSAGLIACAQPKNIAAKVQSNCDNLNEAIENLALENGNVSFLASPILGGGITVTRFEMLFLLAIRHGAKTAQAMAVFARDCLNQVGQQILEDGKPIQDQNLMLQHLEAQANKFCAERLTILKNLMIA